LAIQFFITLEFGREYKVLHENSSGQRSALYELYCSTAKFYNPTLALAQKASFAEVLTHCNDEAPPGPPPETWDAYSKKSGESTNVVAMIDVLIADLDKEMTEAKAEEKNYQEDYETMMAESAAKTIDA